MKSKRINFTKLASFLIIAVILVVAVSPAMVSAGDDDGDKVKIGCTPGYWKNHLDAWPDWPPFFAGYLGATDITPDFSINDFFNLHPFSRPDAFVDFGPYGIYTLEQALNAGGGDYYALARHAAAAILNMAWNYWNYDGDIVHLNAVHFWVESVFAGDNDWEGVKDLFEFWNEELPCPLD